MEFVGLILVASVSIYLYYKLFPDKIVDITSLGDLGKWAIVTGATDGIGKAFTHELASEGYHIVLVSRTVEKLESCAKEIENKFRVSTKIIQADFMSLDEQMYSRIKEELKDLEVGILVNNVGTCPPHPEYFLDMEVHHADLYQGMLNCNITSAVQMTRYVLPGMVDKGKGLIINISSQMSTLPSPLHTLYGATKSFLTKFSQDLDTEYSGKGVHVHVLKTGLVGTKLSGVKKSAFYAVSPEVYVKNALVEVTKRKSCDGYFIHSIFSTFYEILLFLCPELLVSIYLYYKLIPNKIVDISRLGEWAIVTGATDGIGKAFTHELASKGYHIVLVSRTVKKLESCAKEIENKFRVFTKIIQADFMSLDEQMYSRIKEELKDLEVGILVNNVGTCPPHPEYFLDMEAHHADLYQGMLNCNITSAVQMTRYVLPGMVDKGKGLIINISSQMSTLPSPLHTLYGATKSFLTKFSQDLDTEYSGKGVHVHVLKTGLVGTKLSGVKKSAFYAVSPEVYVKNALVEVTKRKSCDGYFIHSIFSTFYEILLFLCPELLVSIYLYYKLFPNKIVDISRLGKWAIVTGATDGIGKAFTHELASKGYHIVLVSRTVKKLESCAEEIENKFRVSTKIIQADFMSLDEQMYSRIKEELKDLEVGILVNNVGTCPPHPEYFLDMEAHHADLYQGMLNCNITSAVQMTRYVLPGMVDKGKGLIINISSQMSTLPSPLHTLYGATKSFLTKFSQDLDTEYSGKGVHVHVLKTGLVGTKLSGAEIESILDISTLGSWAVVTGATDGIGRAFTHALAKMGYNVVLISRSSEKLISAAEDIEWKFQVSTKIVQADFLSLDEQMYNRIEQELKNMDVGILVNNVGTIASHPEYFLDLENHHKYLYQGILNCNITSAVNMTRYVLPGMVKRSRGLIINVSSMMAVLPAPLHSLYGASKSFILKFSQDLDTEYGEMGIHVHVLKTGLVATKMSGFGETPILAPSPRAYVDSALKELARRRSCEGHLAHRVMNVIVSLGCFVMPNYTRHLALQFWGAHKRRRVKHCEECKNLTKPVHTE
ncbi:hypothetical protein GE061_011300 [Apolygus lucorum]|uniref:Uncharacterized protein n=1 Tax=Apolygus lucorum TaxID=248454 RepID=A0A8S9XYH3_APOLU|nr:hypothetical protein GE061_011300 [Apolygus lucorum]